MEDLISMLNCKVQMLDGPAGSAVRPFVTLARQAAGTNNLPAQDAGIIKQVFQSLLNCISLLEEASGTFADECATFKHGNQQQQQHTSPPTEREASVEANRSLSGQQALRHFFLENLHNPFPDKEAKEDLLVRVNDGVPADEQMSDASMALWFINIRRRSGWTAFNRKYAHGSKENLRQLVDLLDLETPAEDHTSSAHTAQPHGQDALRTMLIEFANNKRDSELVQIDDRPRRQTKKGQEDFEAATDADQCRADYRAIVESIAIRPAERVGEWIDEVIAAADQIRAEDDDGSSSIAGSMSTGGSSRKRKMTRSDSFSSDGSASPSLRRAKVPAVALTSPFGLDLPSGRFATSSTRQSRNGPLVPTQASFVAGEPYRAVDSEITGMVRPGTAYSTSSSSSLVLSPIGAEPFVGQHGQVLIGEGHRPQQQQLQSVGGEPLPPASYYEIYGSEFAPFQSSQQIGMDQGDPGVSPSFQTVPLGGASGTLMRSFGYSAQVAPQHYPIPYQESPN